MPPHHRCPLPSWHFAADVAVPHCVNDSSIAWPFGENSAIVRAGRTQAAYLLKRGLWGDTSPAVQDYWSRGCQRAHVSYLVFAWWRLLPLARQKKKPSPMWQSRFQPSLPTQANTSDPRRRAGDESLGQHAALSSRIWHLVRVALAVGLSVLWQPMLRTDAVPNSQDRSLC